MLLLDREGRCLVLFGKERFGWLPVGVASGNRDQFFLRVAQRGQFTTKDAASIDIDGAVEPFGFRHSGMTIDDHRLATVFRRPIVANGQTKLIGFTRRFAIQSKLAYLTRSTSLH